MEKRLFVVKVGPDGKALLGTIAMRTFNTSTSQQIRKEPGQTAQLHKPTKAPVLLTIREGSHTIFTCKENGAPRDWAVTLNAGDQILFCDMSGNGHGSEAGPDGALLEPADVLDPIDLDALGWEETCFPQ